MVVSVEMTPKARVGEGKNNEMKGSDVDSS